MTDHEGTGEAGGVSELSEASRYLRTLARGLAGAYVTHTRPRAVLLTGSAATGESDGYSDIDLILYYHRHPSKEALAAAREQVVRELGAEPVDRPHGDWYAVRGVLCQVARSTVDGWDAQLARAAGPDFLEGDQKALSGLLQGIPLHGADLIRERQARVAVYPEALARATVERYLSVLPVWRKPRYWAERDATLWFHQAVVEGCLHVLGVLAGLNRRYYSSFQFKHLRAFVATLPLAPPDLAARVEGVLAAVVDRPAEAAEGLEALVAETVALVEAHLPEVDTKAVRRDLGQRTPLWTPPSPDGATRPRE